MFLSACVEQNDQASSAEPWLVRLILVANLY